MDDCPQIFLSNEAEPYLAALQEGQFWLSQAGSHPRNASHRKRSCHQDSVWALRMPVSLAHPCHRLLERLSQRLLRCSQKGMGIGPLQFLVSL